MNFDYDKAIKHHRAPGTRMVRPEKIYHHSQGFCEISIADLFKEGGKYKKAEAYYDKAFNHFMEDISGLGRKRKDIIKKFRRVSVENALECSDMTGDKEKAVKWKQRLYHINSSRERLLQTCVEGEKL